MAPRRPNRIHWYAVPAALVYLVVAWVRWGPLLALPLLLGGLGLGVFVEWRARRRDREPG